MNDVYYFSSLIGGMQVDKKTGPPFERRSDFVRKAQRQDRENDDRKHDGMNQPRRQFQQSQT